jgi:hypothetical protein
MTKENKYRRNISLIQQTTTHYKFRQVDPLIGNDRETNN